MKTIIIIAALLFSVNATEAADTTATHKAPRIVPIRYFYEEGYPIPPQEIWIIHEKDLNEDGWKFDNMEWKRLYNGSAWSGPPMHYVDPVHGSNGGYDYA